jgi:hypothetical protein
MVMNHENINNSLLNTNNNKLSHILTNNVDIGPVFNYSKNSMVIINIEVMRAKEILVSKGEVVLIDINRRLYNDIIYIIKTYF